MTKLALSLLLSVYAVGCAAPVVGEQRSSSSNAVISSSGGDKQLCSIRDTYLKDDIKAFKVITVSALPDVVSSAISAANQAQTPVTLATFSVANIGTTYIAGYQGQNGTMIEYFSGTGTLLGVATLRSNGIVFQKTQTNDDGTVTLLGDTLDCTTQQPDGTGPDLVQSTTTPTTNPGLGTGTGTGTGTDTGTGTGADGSGTDGLGSGEG